MKRFRKILVWIEDVPDAGSALDQATALARSSGASLTLAHAVEPPGRLLRALHAQAAEVHSVLRREWEGRLEALAGPLRDEGLKVSTRTLEGKPFIEFTRAVLREEHDLLVKPADDPASGPFFGTTDLHLLRKCPCAVWITNRTTGTSPGILALVDPDPQHDEVNKRILQMASALGELRDAPVHVLHVWRLEGESLLASRVQAEKLTSLVQAARDQSAQDLGRVLKTPDVQIEDERVHLVKGDVREVVPQFVERYDVGLVVMGTLGRTGIHGVLIGNTAETVLGRVNCPVLTVKPRGFVSPVEA